MDFWKTKILHNRKSRPNTHKTIWMTADWNWPKDATLNCTGTMCNDQNNMHFWTLQTPHALVRDHILYGFPLNVYARNVDERLIEPSSIFKILSYWGTITDVDFTRWCSSSSLFGTSIRNALNRTGWTSNLTSAVTGSKPSGFIFLVVFKKPDTATDNLRYQE